MPGDTTGVALLAEIMRSLAGPGAETASDLTRRLGAARATTFDLLRRLEAAGFVDRDAMGRMAPGLAGAALGFAALGVAGLARAGEALLPALRDDTDASVELIVPTPNGEIVLARRLAAGATTEHVDLDPTDGSAVLDEAVLAGERTVAVVRLHVRPNMRAAERAAAHASLRIVAARMAREIDPNGGDR